MNPAIIQIILGIFIGANVKPPHFPWQKPDPNVAALVAAQKAAVDAETARKEAEAKLEGLRKKKDDNDDSSLAYGQQMSSAAAQLLEKAPQTKEVVYARGYVSRTMSAITAVRGVNLTLDQQKEIDAIVAGQLSTLQAEVDKANAALAVKDAKLEVVTQQNTELKVQIATATVEKRQLEDANDVSQAMLQSKTTEAASWIQKKEAADNFANTLQKSIYFWGIIITVVLGGCYWFVHYGLPSFALDHQDSPATQWLYKKITTLACGHEIDFPAPKPKAS